MRRPMVTALAEEAAKYGTIVIAINRPLCPFTTIFRKPGRIRELMGRARPKKLHENLYLYSPRYFLHDFVAGKSGLLESINLAILRRGLRRILGRLDITEIAPIVWYYYPQQGYVTRLFPGSFNIYEIYDNLTDIQGREIPYLVSMEKRWRGAVDLVLTANEDIFNRYGRKYEIAWVFGNGLARDIFEKLVSDRSESWPGADKIGRPRVGYAGMVSDRLDWELIRKLAGERPNWQFVFAGRIDDAGIPGEFNSFKNVHFTGEYKHEMVPAILGSFDAAILPYRDNDFFHSFKPLKFYEYAAAGLPTVSTRSDELKLFSAEFVKNVPGKTDKWLEAIETQLRADRSRMKEIGREIASRHIWDNMGAELLSKLKKHLESL
ncbi:hypothetical protein TRIP_C20573 [Candidatus Zixiibacteriota bacterium]|nr:hypothetical protein TRIP_C20573 [candidate division Zixibacteria bacterium]